MTITKRDFVCENDFELVDRFLSDTYILYNEVRNWDNARWSFNRFCIHNEEEIACDRLWDRGAQIWEDGNMVVGVCHYEEPGDYFLQAHPEYKEIEDDMIKWAMHNCRELFPDIESISVTAHHNDVKRKALISKYGGIKVDLVDEYRRLSIDRTIELSVLPEGYKVVNIDTSNRGMCEEIAKLYTSIWPNSVYMPNGETVKNFVNSKAFSSDLSFLVTNENDESIAFYVIWSDSYEKHAHLYPFGIKSKYRGSLIPKFILGMGNNVLYSKGFDSLTLSAWYSEEEEAAFDSLGFVKTGFSETYMLKL